MAKGLAAVLMASTLRGRKDERRVFDGARAHQHGPMRLPGLPSEGRRNRDERCAGIRQCPVQHRKSQVVADRQAEPAPRQVGDDGALARLIAARLAVALAAGEIDVEHMDLVVARDDLALWIDYERAVGGTLRRDLDRQRTDVEMDMKHTRQLAECRNARITFLRRRCGQHQVALVGDDIGHLRRLHVVGTGGLRLADQLRGGIEVGGGHKTRAHLHQANRKSSTHACVSGPAASWASPSRASSGSSLPSRSSMCSSSLPPMAVPSMKICGTVYPPERSIILRRPSGSPLTLISVKLTPLRVNSALAERQ